MPANKVERFFKVGDPPNPECAVCGGQGYRGRIGVYELLIITDRIRELLKDQGSAAAIKAEAHKEGVLFMREEGLRIVARGVTSVEELMRVVK